MTLLTALKNSSNASQVLGTGLQYHAENVANANDPDYQRTQVRYQNNGAFLSLGTPERAHDNGISRELLLQRGVSGESGTLDRYLTSLSTTFGLNGNTPYLTDAFQRFQQSWRDFQASPDLASVRQIVVDSGENLAEQINELSFALSDVRQSAEGNINADIRDANSLLREIGRLNARIANSRAQQNSVTLLENQRDTALNSLSSILAVQTATDDNGVVTIHTRTGHLLLSAGDPRELSYNGGTREISLGDETNILASNANNRLSHGSLKAHFDIIRDGADNTSDTDDAIGLIAKYELMLDDLVTQITSSTDTTSFNEAFARSTGTPAFRFFNSDATRNDIAINDDLLDGTVQVPTDAVQTSVLTDNIIDVLGLETREINNTDLLATLRQENKTYQGLINGIIELAGQTINSYESLAEIDALVRDGLKEQLVNRTGVNADEELTHIQQLQTLYTANAKIIATINSLFNDLLNIV